ncbi:DinB family protein [Streptomyces sp. ST2-7A]|uniref:DinB family protein n=1 Tax=Streptomyces sp. ST2-7A TaxID=2907214 RepID=UPI001F3A8D48|nr:DinB family protein [Streptomyces sp. ST2-7A]MCE7082369.1 DinB family protein [Streptomyces sp. ST2-7A]
MFLPREEDPRTDGGFRGERDVIIGYLEDQRRTLMMKCADLTPEQLSRRAVEPSNLSLLGLVRHMADVERGWFRRVMAGEDAPPLWRRRPDREDPDGDFNGAAADPAVVAEAWERWEEEVAFARRLVAGAPDLGVIGTGRGKSVELREVLVHMIEEYARHNGHADLLRERIDGRVGQ